jgi:hypothetical protein
MKRTLKTLMVLAAFAGFASAANAASVVLSSDAAQYTPGQTITLTVTVTADAGETDTSVFGVVLYTAARVAPVALSQDQNPLPATANGPWNQGLLPACTTAACRAFSQTNAGGAINTANFVIATMQFTAGGILGSTSFNWQSTPVSQRLDFFGVTGAPGVTVEIVPEPTTAALLGLGLFGLAVAGRRRN